MTSHKVICAECGSPMKLRNSRYGLFYGCTKFPECDGKHGAHADGKPFGTPATKEVKQARIAAHAEFDKPWKTPGPLKMKRGAAYRWMQKAMGLEADKAHIGMFDKAQCEQLIQKVQEWFGTRMSATPSNTRRISIRGGGRDCGTDEQFSR